MIIPICEKLDRYSATLCAARRGVSVGSVHSLADVTPEAAAEAMSEARDTIEALYESLNRLVDEFGGDPSVESSVWREAAAVLETARETPNA